MRTVISFVLAFVFVFASATSTSAQTLLERAALSQLGEFQQRVGMAAMQVSVSVAVEPPDTAEHVTRMRMASWTITEPETVAKRLSILVASVQGMTQASTDAEIKALLETYWTTIAMIFSGRR